MMGRRSILPRRESKTWRNEPLGTGTPFLPGSYMARRDTTPSTETRTCWVWLGREWHVRDIERFD